MKRGLSICAIALAGALFLGGAAAQAATGPFPSFTVKGSDDYKIYGSAFGGSVSLTPSAGKSYAQYTANGTSTKDTIDADFQSYGSIHFTDFKPKGRKKTQRVPRRCEGKPARIQKGTWKGHVNLTTSFTTADKNKAPGQLYFPGDITCKPPKNVPKYTSLVAQRSILGGFVYFNALKQTHPDRPTTLYGIMDMQDGDVDVRMVGSTNVPDDSFEANVGAGTASVSSKYPFLGTASLSGGNWSGNLSVLTPMGSIDLIGGMTATVSHDPPLR